MNLFRRRKISDLQNEVLQDHSLRRALGPLNLTTLGIGAVIGAGIFVLTGQAAASYAGPADCFLLHSGGLRLRPGRSLLRGVCLHDTDLRLGLHLQLRHPGRVRRLDHRVGLDPGILVCRQHRGGGMVRLRRLLSQRLAGLQLYSRGSSPPRPTTMPRRPMPAGISGGSSPRAGPAPARSSTCRRCASWPSSQCSW